MKKIIAFGKLLSRVRHSGIWNEETFHSESEKAGVTKSEAIRFYKALIKSGCLVKGKDKRRYTPVFDSKIWHNEDAKNHLVKRILSDNDIIQKRGRVKGVKYPVKKIETTAIVVSVNPLDKFSATDLVMELRSRGFEVTCKRSVTVVEEL